MSKLFDTNNLIITATVCDFSLYDFETEEYICNLNTAKNCTFIKTKNEISFKLMNACSDNALITYNYQKSLENDENLYHSKNGFYNNKYIKLSALLILRDIDTGKDYEAKIILNKAYVDYNILHLDCAEPSFNYIKIKLDKDSDWDLIVVKEYIKE